MLAEMVFLVSEFLQFKLVKNPGVDTIPCCKYINMHENSLTL